MELSALWFTESGVCGTIFWLTLVLSSACFGGLQAAPKGVMGIYGDIMFKSQFVAFNGGNNSIGMANHV